MSYWPAEDESSSEIMGLFYQYLANGMNKDVALRKAKIEFLASAPPFRQSPAYWNNFVVLGDVSPIVVDNTWFYISISCFFITVVLISIFFYYRKHRVKLF